MRLTYPEGEHIRALRRIAHGLHDDAARVTVSLGLLLATIGRMEPVIRPVFELFRKAVPCDTLGYFWADDQGNMINAFAEQPLFLRADVVTSCMRYQQEDSRNWPSFNENVLAGPVSGYLLPYQNARFHASNHFAETYARIGAHFILDSVVHDGTRPRGCFLIMRSQESGAFSAADIAQSRRFADVLLLQGHHRTSGLQATRRSDVGRMVIDREGRVRFADAAAYQTLWMVTREAGAPVFGDAGETIDTMFALALNGAAQTARTAGRSAHEVECFWGSFEADLVESEGELFVSLVQIEPFQAELARRMVLTGLSPTRVIVAWLLVSGMQRKGIAGLLEMGMDTLSDHITAIYRALSVRSLAELMVRMLG